MLKQHRFIETLWNFYLLKVMRIRDAFFTCDRIGWCCRSFIIAVFLRRCRIPYCIKSAVTSVPDPWHFGVDPDPRIHAPTNGSGSCHFRHWPWRRQQKTNLKKKSAYYFLNVYLHHFSKIKSPKEVAKQYGSRFFLLFLLDDRRIRIRIRIHNSD